MIPGLQIPFDRVTYRDGQLLRAGDMQDDQTRNSRLWALHTRYLHDTWGIATGFQVSGSPGDSLLQIGAGYAVDQQGRPLVSSQTVPVPLPLVTGPEYQVLVMSYRKDATYRDRAGLEGLCFGEGQTVMQESPSFIWKLPAEVRVGTDVPLATAQVSNGTLVSLDLRARRYVQKLLRPYIAAGATDQGSTQWNPNQLSAGYTLYSASIDTTDGAFNNTPYYFPELHMWNQAPASIYGVTNQSANSDFVDYSGPFTFITSPSSTGFTFNLIMRPIGGVAVDPNAAQWTVSWIGVEVAQCQPPFDLLIALILNFPRHFPITFQAGKLL